MKFYTGRVNFLLITLCFSLQAFGQSPINRLYGTYATETGKKGFVRSDSTIYALGTSSAFTGLSSQVYLMKADKNGNLLWSRFYGGAGVDDATDMYYHTDTCIYIVSNTYNGPEKGYDIGLVKTDLDGLVLWEKTYGTTDWDVPARLTRISANAFVVCGHTYGGSLGLADGMLFAFDADGDSLWFRSTGSSSDDFLYDLVLKSPDTVAACGERLLASGKKQAWITELSISTQNAVSYYYGMDFNYTFNAMDLMPGGGYGIGLTSDSASGTQNDVFIWKIHPYTHAIDLNIVNYAPGDEYCTDLFQHNGKFHMLNNTTSYGLGGYDALVYRFDTLYGFYLDGYTYGTSEDNFGNSIFLNNSGTFALVGTSPKEFGPSDLWIVNVDNASAVYAVPDEAFDANSVEETAAVDPVTVLYPNPATGGFYYRSSLVPDAVEVYDGTGRMLLSTNGPGAYVPLTGVAAGLYRVQLRFADGSVSSKPLVVR